LGDAGGNADTKRDGRSLRRTGRTEPFSTKVKPETLETIHRIAAAEGMTMVKVLEAAINLYDRQLRGK
jgi:hypothetical protein